MASLTVMQSLGVDVHPKGHRRVIHCSWSDSGWRVTDGGSKKRSIHKMLKKTRRFVVLQWSQASSTPRRVLARGCGVRYD